MKKHFNLGRFLNSLIKSKVNYQLIAILAMAIGLALAGINNGYDRGAEQARDQRRSIIQTSMRQSDSLQEPSPDSPDEAMRWRRLAWVDEKGVIPPQALMDANRQREENIVYQQARLQFESAGITPSSWASRGPQNVGGRTRSLVIHPTNPNILWAGAVGGGIWKSTNAGTSWTPSNDFLANLAANCLAIAPSNPNTLYCGTGEGFFNIDAINGAGIFKTTDGGTTWNQLPATANWDTVNRIAIAPTNSNLILAAKRYGGIQRSTDGGLTWSNPQFTQGSYYLAFDPTDSNKAIAHIIDYNFIINDWFHSVLYSTDAGATWQESNVNHVYGFNSRMELAYAPSNSNIAYASFQTPITCSNPPCPTAGRVWRSTDGGHNFSQITQSADTGASWYNNTIWVSPTNSNFIVVGGAVLYKSSDAGATFTQISDGYILTQQPHPDQHVILSESGFNGTTNRRVYVCNDGGIFRTDDIFTASTTSGWVSLNNTYQTTQYFAAAGHAGTGLIIGGTQDNGTLRSPLSSQNATLPFGGDGGFSAIDPTDDTYCYGEYITLQIHRSQDHGLSSSYIYSGLGDAVSGNANFIAPFILDPNDHNRMLAGGISLWRSDNVRLGAPPTWSAIRAPGSTVISAIAVAQGNSNIIWVAQNDGQVYKTNNGLSAIPLWSAVDDNSAINPLADRFVTRILIDPDDSNKVYVALGGFTDGNLQRTTDGGVTWADVTGAGVTGLPLAPIRGITRHPNNQNWLYAGTEVGIFTSEDGGATWSATGQGPANVSVDELTFIPNSTVLLAATHGRGLWTASANGSTPRTLTVASLNPASGVSITVSPNDNNMQGSGMTQFTRNYNSDTLVTLTAPATASGNNFLKWQRDGADVSFSQTTTVTMDADHTMTAVYAGSSGNDTIGVYFPSNQTFYLRNSNSPGFADLTLQYGPSGATPVVGDFDGNGTTTIGVYLPSNQTFYLRNSNSVGFADLTIRYGPAGATPLAGDWDGNGTATIGVYDSSMQTFYLRNSNNVGSADLTIRYGPSGAIPIAGDWDGNGTTTIGVYDPATQTFYLRNSNSQGNADIVIRYGPSGATPVVGDFDGNGTTTIGVYLPSNQTFYLRNSNSVGFADLTIQYGPSGATPLAGDWNGL